MAESTPTPPKTTYIVDFEPPEKEKARLDSQHYAVVENYGHLLPPAIPDHGSLTAVAEIATGTGIWLEQLSKELPLTVILHGYDVNDRLFPDPATLPPNLTFSLFDVLLPVAETLYEKYDVVHIRGLCMVLKQDQWDGVVKNVAKMIKPGGYLVWTETDLGGAQSIPPAPTADKVASILGYMCKLRGGDPFCTAVLPTYLKDNGFSLIPPPPSSGPNYTPAPPSPSLGHYIHIPGADYHPSTVKPFSKNFVRGLCSIISYMAQYNIPNEWFTAETAGEFVEKFIAETDGEDGTRVLFDMVCVVGKKE
ncbi:hypothetical protein H072_7114 [Dactylellina haptotyla CBS 200.50]|uniref:Methyltransferase domain-containing protein n=1 Tax=Dactylellina haptotyla (strain CBS 200.50) TaxID=1284197 RepID=S8BIF2_DACHA|nr:hypothetical protein H072_7114 [Dactylellina haptotyla CBS 200.50]